MSVPSPPTGYEVSKHVPHGRSDCHLTVGFDRRQGQHPISRFLVILHYQISTSPVQWGAIARMDHNDYAARGHDVYSEGLHVDIARRSKPTEQLDIPHSPLPTSRGKVIRRCGEYLEQETAYFINVFEEQRSPGTPPRWSDGGNPARTFISTDPVGEDMCHEEPAEEDILTFKELSEVLAEVEGTTAEEIERGAAEIDIAPPEEGEVVKTFGDAGPLDA